MLAAGVPVRDMAGAPGPRRRQGTDRPVRRADRPEPGQRRGRVVLGSLKRELVSRFRFDTPAEGRRAIIAWINHYNAVRLHSSLGNVPPIEWELRHLPFDAARHRRGGVKTASQMGESIAGPAEVCSFPASRAQINIEKPHLQSSWRRT